MSVNSPILAKHHWYQKEDKSFIFWIRDEDGNDVDLQAGAYTFRWIFAESVDAEASILLDKTSVTVVDYTEGPDDPLPGTVHPNAGARVTVTAAETELLESQIGWHELWKTNVGDRSILANGEAVLLPSRAR